MNSRPVVLVSLAVALSGCVLDETKSDDTGRSGINGDTQSANDTGTDLDTDLDTGEDAEPFEILSFSVQMDTDCVPTATANLELTGPATTTLYVQSEGGEPRALATLGPASDLVVPVLGMGPDSAHTVWVEVQGNDDDPVRSEDVVVQTCPLPDDLPPIVLNTSDPERSTPGHTVLTVARWNPFPDAEWSYVVVVNAEGAVIWYQKLDGLAIGLFEDDGRIYTSEFTLGAVEFDPFGQTSTSWAAEDLGIDSVHHEIRPMDDDGMLLLSSELRVVDGFEDPLTLESATYNVVGDVLAEVNAEGEVDWTWSAFDHIDPVEHHTLDLHMAFWELPPYDGVDTPKDWTHANAVVPIEDDWLVSMRNLDWLVRVNRETGEIVWRFGPEGDFELSEGARWHSRQHAPEVLENGNILIYDNGNARADAGEEEAPWSRVVEFSLDEETGIATEVWSYAGEEPYFSMLVGDADRFANGNTLITDGAMLWGMKDLGEETFAPFFSGRVREITGDADPEIVWELEVGHPNELEQDGYMVYRGIRFESLYPESVWPD